MALSGIEWGAFKDASEQRSTNDTEVLRKHWNMRRKQTTKFQQHFQRI